MKKTDVPIKCDKCGDEIQIGSWPFCPDHSKPSKTKGWEPYFCEQLGQMVTGLGDINKAMRPHWENDHLVHIQPRDKSASYYRELNERRAHRAEMERKERSTR